MKSKATHYLVYFSLLLILSSHNSFCQIKFLDKKTVVTTASNKKELRDNIWSISPFDQKVFVENAGQFEEVAHNTILSQSSIFNYNSKVLYSAFTEGLDVYFYSNGLTFKKDNFKNASQDIIQSDFLSVEWLNVNSDIKVIATEDNSFYYTFGGFGINDAKKFKAKTCQKILYKNIYPNIDIEYSYSENSKGLKYNIYLHPGANPNDLKFKYHSNNKVNVSLNDSLIIDVLFAKFIDEAPISFKKNNGEKIESKFIVNNGIVGFDINQNTITEEIIIDPTLKPFLSSTTFSNYNSAYDIGSDLAGGGSNVYVYGSYAPYKIAKYDTLGVLQWIFNSSITQNLPSISRNAYGDFVVDRDGFSYLGEGYNSAGARLIKIDSLGFQVAAHNGSPNLQSIWRMELDWLCMDMIVLAGGGALPYQAGTIDKNFINMFVSNVLNNTTEGNHDMALLTVDNVNGNAYMATSKSLLNNNFNNYHLSLLYPFLSQNTLFSPTINNGNNFGQNNSVNYINGYIPQTGAVPANGMNGMAVSENFLYVYNGDTIKVYNKATGTQLNAVAVGNTPVSMYNGSRQVKWGGIDVDDCDRVYVGYGKNVICFTNNFTQRDTIAMPDTVYDVKIYENLWLLDVCGKGFVTRTFQAETFSVTWENADSCKCNGHACFGGACFPVTGVQWSTGQTTNCIYNLCPGLYYVDILAPACYFSIRVYFEIKQTDFPTFSDIYDTICQGNSYTLPWGPVVTQPGSYSNTTIGAKGCPHTETVHLHVLPPITDTINITICQGNSYVTPWGDTLTTGGSYNDTLTNGKGCDSIIVIVLNITPPPVTTLNVTICQGVIYNLPWGDSTGVSGNYSDTLTTSNGCDSIILIVLTVTPAPVTNISASICPGKAYPSPWGGQPISSAGTFTDTLTTSKGCDSIIILTLNVLPYENKTISATICSGNSYLLPDGSYVSASGLYSDTLTGTLGCDTIVNINLTVVPAPITNNIVNICEGDIWLLPNGQIANETGVYTDTLTSLKGCDSLVVTSLIVNSAANEFKIPNVFTPNSDGMNDLFTLTKGWSECFEIIQIEIYNRWGIKIYESVKSNIEWDGIIQGGDNASDGTYYYVIKYKTQKGDTGKKAGYVSVLR